MNEFLKEQLDLQYFYDHQYTRKKCLKCGAYFWTLNPSDDHCGDQPCVPFHFIGKPIGDKPLTLHDVRESFLTYFEQHKHTRLHYPKTGERYPVVARWRSDIYLTIASIADFQPHVTSGEVPPPANPLAISQPCIRLNDLDEVGKSGRHLTMFEMMGHHAFNKEIDEIYWKEQTVFYCDDFFVNTIGIPREEITYKEQLWHGGGNAGPCLEVLAGGLEIATLVFMNMKEAEDGEYTIGKEIYTQNPLNIVDTGYGLERIAWITQGTKTVYETVFPEVIDWIRNHLSSPGDDAIIMSLADHTKSLAFMLGDGIVPSNVKAGYLARLLIRRCLRFIEHLQMDHPLEEIIDLHISMLKQDFPSLSTQQEQIHDMIQTETKRYHETLQKGKNMVQRLIAENQEINSETLITLYDTHGMPPKIVQTIAEKQGITVTIPENFESMVADLHSKEEKQIKQCQEHRELPATEPLYYHDHYLKEFDATVTWTEQNKNETLAIFDKTSFYPDGGGQPGDQGMITTSSGETFQVSSVVKENNAILHHIKGSVSVGEHIHGHIDWGRRYQLMKHHTGTHVVNGALQHVLGDHIWQAGSQLAVKNARFDYTHYKSISENELKEIEIQANKFINERIPVEKHVLDRNTAEKTYGFRLYQGGVPPGNSIRVLYIPGVDVEACGGTHLNNIGEIEKIRLLKSERIQDGVNRIIFACGAMVDEYQKEEQQMYETIVSTLESSYKIQHHEEISHQLDALSNRFSVPADQLPKTLKRFLKEARDLVPKNKEISTLEEAGEHLFSIWKKTKKQKKAISEDELSQLLYRAEQIPGTKIKVLIAQTDTESNATAGALIEQGSLVVHIYDGKKITSAASEDVPIDLGKQIAPTVGKLIGGSGGGRPRMAQSGGPKKDAVDEALEKAKELTIEILKKE